MNIEDLMVGNLVQTKNGEYVRIGLVCDSGKIVVNFSDGRPREVCYIDDLQPIKLTYKILEKIGFVYEGSLEWCIYKLKTHKWFTLYKKEFGYYLDVGKSETLIHSIHELQNAFKLFKINQKIVL